VLSLRIENHVKPGLDPVKKEKADSAHRTPFTDMMTHSKGKLHREALDRLMARIEEKGEFLARKMTVEHLRDYKKLVRQFVEEAVQYGLELKDKQGFNLRGRSKNYKIVEEIDQKLVEVTNKVVGQEKNGIHILSLVGEIKGLMINLYM
jgi:uncharacterized protein YaaR (DUF327 family)